MTKANVSQWDTTAANNTDIQDIPLGENLTRPTHVNNAFREVMAQIKTAIGVSFQAYSAALADLSSRWTAASTSGPASLDFREDADNGTSRVRVIAAAALASDRAFTLPDVDISFSSFIATLLDDADASTARTTLGIPFTAASASGPASLDLAEDTDNGAHKITLIAPASIASDKTVTFQDITGTVYVSNGTDVAIADGGTGAGDAATAFSNLKQAASDTATGVIEIAVQSEMETGTDTTRAVVPGRQHYHPGHPKCWAFVTQSGATPSLTTSYNITSITDAGTGTTTVTIATDFSTANWAAMGTVDSGNENFVSNITKGAGAVTMLCWDSNGATLVDPSAGWNFVGLGDHA